MSSPTAKRLMGSVLYDEEEEIYKAWCFGLGDAGTSRPSREVISGGVYYFTSKDGIHWERPELNVVTLEGSPTNVVVLASHSQHEKRWPGFYELFGVSKNQSDPDPSRRYKMGYLYLIRDYHGSGEARFHSGQRRGLGVAFSPDGIHWTPMDDAVTQATCDGATHWFYDEKRGRYILYGRTKHIAPEVRARYGEDRLFQRNHWGRAVNRAESEDFVHWMSDLPAVQDTAQAGEGELVLAVDVLDGPGDEIYSMSVFPYEGIYIGLIQMFHNYYDSVYLDVQLAVSRDSVHFERLSDRSPFIPVGGVGTWDRFNNSLANNPPIRIGDELRFYYGGRNYLHSGLYKGPDGGPAAGGFRAGVGLGTIKLDRFAAMEATFDPGTLRTKPFVFEGKRLHLNANVKFGSIEVTLLNVAGNPIEGMQSLIYGQDSVDIQAPMEIGKLSGEPKQLEFTIRNAQLYSFWVD